MAHPDSKRMEFSSALGWRQDSSFPLGLFLLLIVLNWRRRAKRAINQQRRDRALSKLRLDLRSAWSQRNRSATVPSRRTRYGHRQGPSSIIVATTERLRNVRFEPRDDSSTEYPRPAGSFVLARSKSLPPTRCKRLSSCVISQPRLSGFVVSSKISGSDEAYAVGPGLPFRIPADHFEEARCPSGGQ